MSAKIIDGRLLAKNKRNILQKKIESHTQKGNRPPCLAVIIVGDDPASQIYVKGKEKACKSVGIDSRVFVKPANVSCEELIEVLQGLAKDVVVDGILLQLPLPKHLRAEELLEYIPASKDVDGLTLASQGMLAKNQECLLPCTPRGIMQLLSSENIPVKGALAAVIGRSVLVGSSVTRLLEHSKATTISIASCTRDAKTLTAQADIVIAAAGCCALVKSDWIKPGAVVIDVGIHRQGSVLCGDVDYTEVSKVAGWVTPVPGGVGPMTIAMLLENCWLAYLRRTR